MVISSQVRNTRIPHRRALLTTGVALAILVATSSHGCNDWIGAEPFYLGGIQVNEPDHELWFKTLKQVGMNTVEVTVYARQGDWDSDNLWFDDEDPGVLAEIRAARRHGVRVALVLRVALDHAFERNQFLWHGMIMPRTEAQLAEWFRRYQSFAVKWAGIAEREGVALLAVASEMNSLTNTTPVTEIPALEEYYLNADKQGALRSKLLSHEDKIEAQHLWVAGGKSFDSLEAFLTAQIATNQGWASRMVRQDEEETLAEINRRRRLLESHWVSVIDAVRSHFSGSITYAANFDQYFSVGFWDKLDLIGINAYFKLRTELVEVTDASDLYPLLEAGWTRIFDELQAFRRVHGLEDKPVLFTELGYTFRRNSTLEPWAASGFSLVGPAGEEELIVWKEQPVDFLERALAVRALRAVSQAVDADLLQGILYWKLSTQSSHLEIEPFVLIVGPESDDQMLAELLAFVR